MDLPSREAIDIEFKSDRKMIADSTIVEEVVALANTRGGDLYIGIEDDGSITGAQPAHCDTVRLASLIAARTVPPVSVRVNVVESAGMQPVVRVEVPQSPSVVATSAGRMLRRRFKPDGSPESVPMFPHEITTRLADLRRLDLTAQPMLDATVDDFDREELDRLRRAVTTYKDSDRSLLGLTDEELEKALGLTVRVDDAYVPTLTGLLLVGRPDVIKRLAPTSEAAFQVLQGTEVKVNQSFCHPLLYVIEKMMELLEPWSLESEVSVGPYMLSVPLFDKRAFREAVVNAFGHRDYSMLGRVRVEIQDEGLTVANPGGFIEGISARNLLTAEPRGRNPCLMDALKRIGLAERTGRGIDRIYEGSLVYGKTLPDYSGSNETGVRLFIASSAPDAMFINMIAEERDRSGRPLSLQSLLVLDALKRYRRCGMTMLADNVDMSAGVLRSTVERLVEAGLVEAAGSGANREYWLNARVYARTGESHAYVRQADIDAVRYPELVMKLLSQQGSVSTPDVRDLLHVTVDQAYYIISKLVKAGRLVKVGKGKGTRYVLPDNVGD